MSSLQRLVAALSEEHNVAMRTILVVDDEPIVRDVVAKYLQREGFRTI